MASLNDACVAIERGMPIVNQAADPVRPSGPAEPLVALEDVSFSYPDGTEVLEGLSLDVPRGSVLSIVGPSGGGKSTMLALVAGLLEPTRGTVDRRVQRGDSHPLAMVFQKDTLLPWLTVDENARQFQRYHQHRSRARRQTSGHDTGSVDEQVESLLDLTHLAASRDKYPYQLSGGMRRRLAFVSAAAVRPQLLLLDEPFSSVDEPTRVGIHEDVFAIARLMEMTMVLVTHDLAEAITLSDRVVILSARPARIAQSHHVPFGRDRDMGQLRESSEFLELYGALWHDLSVEIGRSRG